MKNKRWKRKAKRIKGYCSEEFCSIGGMPVCKYFYTCNKVFWDNEPCNIEIRELERRFKNEEMAD